jgi:protein-disulfide isomerase
LLAYLEVSKIIHKNSTMRKNKSADLSFPVTSSDNIGGAENFEITLLEYGDFECPSCGEAYPIVSSVRQAYKDKLRFVFRNFPLSNIHPNARRAAAAAEAAGIQGKYWEMHDLLFENQDTLGMKNLLDYAFALSLDMTAFEADMNSDDVIFKIEADLKSGIESGVHGTPTFFINGEKFVGDWMHFGLVEFLKKKSIY